MSLSHLVLGASTHPQGLLHTGKGSITMTPLHTERSLVSQVALSGLLCALSAVLDSQNGLSITCFFFFCSAEVLFSNS